MKIRVGQQFIRLPVILFFFCRNALQRNNATITLINAHTESNGLIRCRLKFVRGDIIIQYIVHAIRATKKNEIKRLLTG